MVEIVYYNNFEYEFYFDAEIMALLKLCTFMLSSQIATILKNF